MAPEHDDLDVAAWERLLVAALRRQLEGIVGALSTAETEGTGEAIRSLVRRQLDCYYPSLAPALAVTVRAAGGAYVVTVYAGAVPWEDALLPSGRALRWRWVPGPRLGGALSLELAVDDDAIAEDEVRRLAEALAGGRTDDLPGEWRPLAGWLLATPAYRRAAAWCRTEGGGADGG